MASLQISSDRSSKTVKSAGDQIKFDINEGDAEAERFQEIQDLLVAAGYFRARIKGLSAFDKIVGGICWCVSNVDLDIDILYQENATIGQKIALTEKIVRALQMMKCPNAIEPHQIQGLDVIHIFPVIQWLVKNALEFRTEGAGAVRDFAEFQFSLKNQDEKSVNFRKMNEENFPPKRIFRKLNAEEFVDEFSKVHSTFLEYGSEKNEKFATETRTGAKKSEEKENEKNSSEILQEKFEQLDGKSNEAQFSILSATSVANFLDAKKLRQAVEIYENLSEDRKILGDFSSNSAKIQAKNLQLEVENLRQRIENMRTSEFAIRSKYEEVKNRYDQEEENRKTLIDEIEMLKNLEKSVDPTLVESIKSLTSQQEELRQQELAFKQKCKQELNSLQDQISFLSNKKEAGESIGNIHDETLRKEYDTVTAELGRVRLEMATLNREIASLQRQIDQVPSQQELNQYQRRFLELYNQVASKHKETKQFYTLYNTLLDVKNYLENEVNLLNSVYDNYEQAMLSETGKAQYLKQLEQIVENIKQTKFRLEKRFKDEEIRCDSLKEKLQEFLEQQREYYATVKLFQQECRKNQEFMTRS